MLVLWSAGLAVAAALICYAVAAGMAVTLFVSGVVLAAVPVVGAGWLPGAGADHAGGAPGVAQPRVVGWPWPPSAVLAGARRRCTDAASRGRPETTVR